MISIICSYPLEILYAGLRKSGMAHLNGSLASRWGEEGAGGGHSPPPAPSSPCERLWREQSARAATLAKPCFSKEDLNELDLTDSDLSGTDLSGATLTDANLTGASLSQAVLIDTNFTGANLSQADLSEADTAGAFFRGADLRATIISQEQFNKARMPDELP